MANCKIVEELFECLKLSSICERLLSLGYEKLEDILCIEEEELEKLIENPQDRETFRRRLFEGKFVSRCHFIPSFYINNNIYLARFL